MLRSFAALAAAAALALPAAAQDCSSLAVDSSDDGATTTVSIDVTGTLPDAVVLLAVGQTPGETVLDFGLGSLTVGMGSPFVPVPMGVSDGAGDASLALELPSDPTLELDLLVQAIAVDIELVLPPPPDGDALSLEFCTSNVASLSL